mgnify:CR=1 FL=1
MLLINHPLNIYINSVFNDLFTTVSAKIQVSLVCKKTVFLEINNQTEWVKAHLRSTEPIKNVKANTLNVRSNVLLNLWLEWLICFPRHPTIPLTSICWWGISNKQPHKHMLFTSYLSCFDYAFPPVISCAHFLSQYISYQQQEWLIITDYMIQCTKWYLVNNVNNS